MFFVGLEVMINGRWINIWLDAKSGDEAGETVIFETGTLSSNFEGEFCVFIVYES